MQKSGKKWLSHEEILHIGRAFAAVFALLIAAGHLAYVTASSSSFSSHAAPSNQISTTSHASFSSFSVTSFWFDVEIIAYSIIAVVFLLGLRTWYPLSILFNIFNLGIYFLSGVVGIPGVTPGAFPGRFNIMGGLSSINLIIVGWIVLLILGFVLLKYDPGSKLDELLVTKRTQRGK